MIFEVVIIGKGLLEVIDLSILERSISFLLSKRKGIKLRKYLRRVYLK